MTLEEIERLELVLAEEKERIIAAEHAAYEAEDHKEFDIDDWVTDGDIIGKVQSTKEGGYLNVDIKNNDRGMICNVRANDYRLLDSARRHYYTIDRVVTLRLTGEDVEYFLNSNIGLRNLNPSKSKNKLIDALELIRI